MYSENTKPFLITIHGIRTEGEWQERSEPILQPFFRLRKFKYEEYKQHIASVIWLALQPLGGLVGILAAVSVFFFWHPFTTWRNGVLPALVFAAFWLGCGIIASRRLNKVADRFTEFWGGTLSFRVPPHIVAHSLGTFLTGFCLAKSKGLRAGRLILNGCVLHRYFPWGEIKGDFRVEEVHNEIARKDLTSRLAYALHGSIPRMGHAGVFGFKEPPNTYTWNDPYRVRWYCEKGCSCANPEKRPNEQTAAFVHNLIHGELGHSDVHLGPAHAIAFWLPTLFDIAPLPYMQFRDLCIKCRTAERTQAINESELEDELRAKCWGWTEGPLEDRIRRHVKARLRGRQLNSEVIESLISLAVRYLWVNVATATEEQGDGESAINLWPESALSNAIEQSFADCGIGEGRAHGAGHF